MTCFARAKNPTGRCRFMTVCPKPGRVAGLCRAVVPCRRVRESCRPASGGDAMIRILLVLLVSLNACASSKVEIGVCHRFSDLRHAIRSIDALVATGCGPEAILDVVIPAARGTEDVMSWVDMEAWEDVFRWIRKHGSLANAETRKDDSDTVSLVLKEGVRRIRSIVVIRLRQTDIGWLVEGAARLR